MEFTKAKMWVALIGGSLTAVTTCLATVAVVLDDGLLDVEEYGLVAVALGTLITTVRKVWSTENRPVTRGFEATGQ